MMYTATTKKTNEEESLWERFKIGGLAGTRTIKIIIYIILYY